MARKSLLGAAFVAGLSFAGHLHAEEGAPQGQPPAENVRLVASSPGVWSSSWWSERRFVPRVGYRYDTGSSIGRLDGLSSFQGFVPVFENADSTSLTFSDSRVLLFDNGGYAAINAGAGHRVYNENLNRTLGGYLYYDNQNTGSFTFSQISGGVESLGELIDVRSNFYVPVGTDRKFTSGFYAVQFVGNNLFLGRNAQAAMAGFDAEIGALLYDSGTAAYRIYTGMYDFQVAGSQQAWGWKSRVQANILDNVTLGLSVQTDNVFNTTVNFSTAIYFPRHSARRNDAPRNEPIDVADRLAEPVERIQNMVIASQQGADRTIAIDPNTGLPLFFLHVAAGGASDGSIGDPYGTLAEAFADPRFAAGNVIVYDRTAGTFNGELTLNANTQILSNGPTQYVATQVGQVLLPYSGVDPNRLSTINGTGSGVAAITLADGANNVVLGGLNITNGGNPNDDGVALPVTGGTIQNFTIRDSRISSVDRGISLDAGGGVGDGVIGNVVIANNTISNAVSEGIVLEQDADSALNVTVVGNTISDVGAVGVAAIHLHFNSNGSAATAASNFIVAGNSIADVAGSSNGIDIAVGNGSPMSNVVRGSITGNSIANLPGAGINLFVDGASTVPNLSVSVDSNTLTNNTSFGMLAQVANGGIIALDANGNVAPDGYTLLNNASTFGVVNLPTIGSRNTGAFNFVGSFDNISTLP